MQRTARFWIGTILSLLTLFLAFRNVEWPRVWDAWRMARIELLMVGLALLITSWGIAALRWRVLLYATRSLRVRDTFAYISIGYLANSILPLRLGDLARASLIGRKKGVGISRSLGSIALERVMDLLVLVGITFALAMLIDIPPTIQAGLTTIMGAAFVALAGLVALSYNQDKLPRLLSLLRSIVPERIVLRLLVLVRNFLSGAEVLRRPLGLVVVVLLSAVVWGLVGAATFVWIRSFHLDVPWFGGFFVLVMVNLGSAIPSSPGYVGVYHYLAVLGLSFWVPDRHSALAYAIGTHALNILANVCLGLIFSVREGVSLHDLRTELRTPQHLTLDR